VKTNARYIKKSFAKRMEKLSSRIRGMSLTKDEAKLLRRRLLVELEATVLKTIDECAAHDLQLGDQEISVLKGIRRWGIAATYSQLASLHNVKKKTLTKMIKSGLIRHEMEGHYVLNMAGELALEKLS
jgi:hypothetical protein